MTTQTNTPIEVTFEIEVALDLWYVTKLTVRAIDARVRSEELVRLAVRCFCAW
jgi:hypothetical protein